jgi:TPR repeat protein
MMGFLIEGGHAGLTHDPVDAFTWFKLAADQNNPLALNTVGSCYFNGDGVPQDFRKAYEYYERSAALKCSDALVNLGRMYEYHLVPVADAFDTSIQKRNARKAIECFDEAAELDDPRGCLNAAIFYQKGLLDGVPQLFKSWQLFRKGIALGDILCMVNVAKMYDSGVIQNLGDGISTKVLAQDYRCRYRTRPMHQHLLTLLGSEAFKHYRMAFEAGCDDSDVM